MLPLLVLGSAACSFSLKAGSSSSEAGKPATPGSPDGATPASKPVADAPTDPPADATEPAGDDPAGADPADPEPTRERPGTGSLAPGVEPKLTAVCRVDDPSLAEVCHAVLDPIAADDLAAWEVQLTEEVTLTRPSHQRGTQRLVGASEIRKMSDEAGGLRTLMHLDAADRVVGTVHSDCRTCRRSFVAFETNSRSGTITVTVDMTKPPRVSAVEIASRVRRRHLGEARTRPRGGPATLEAPKEPNRKPTPEPPAEAGAEAGPAPAAKARKTQ